MASATPDAKCLPFSTLAGHGSVVENAREDDSMGQFRIELTLLARNGGPSSTTLEELGLGIDPLNRRLIPVDLYLA